MIIVKKQVLTGGSGLFFSGANLVVVIDMATSLIDGWK
jgi:hypothetical protein